MSGRGEQVSRVVQKHRETGRRETDRQTDPNPQGRIDAPFFQDFLSGTTVMLAPSVAFKLQAKSTALAASAVSSKRSAAGVSWLWRRVLLSPFVQAWLSALGGMRNQKQNARLQHARGQMFICGMFGNCASSVLSPRTPPGIQDFGRKAAIVWAASDCDNLQQEQEHEEESNSNVEQEGATSSVDSERYEGDDGVALRDDRHPAPCSPASSTATSEGDGTTSSASTSTSDRMECSANHIQDAPSEAGRFSVTSEVWDLRQTDLDELVAEVKPGNCTKRSLACLQKHVNHQEGGVIRTSDVAASLITLLLSSNLSAATDTGSCDTSTSSESVDEEHQREEASRTFDDSLAALTVLSEDESTAQLMATPEMLSVVTWYLIKGTRDDARENACLLLEKLSLVEDFKATMGGSPQVMAAIVALLRDEKHPKLAKLATKTLLALCLLRENRRR